jgi:hypothetical protein
MSSESHQSPALGALSRFALWHESVILKACLQAEILVRSGAQCYAQAHIPTEPPPSGEDTWLFDAHEDQSGSSGAFSPPRQGPEARFRECRLPRLASSPTAVKRSTRHTPDFLYAALDTRLSFTESRMKFIYSNKPHRKSGYLNSPRVLWREGITRISCNEAPNRFGCAAFSKESRMKFANANKFDRKSW